MYGVSLPYRRLRDGGAFPSDASPCPELLTPEQLAARLFSLGVSSAELRTVAPGEDPQDVLRAARLLWAQGLRVSVHGQAVSAATAVSDVLGPLTALVDALPRDLQPLVTVTVHPIPGEDVVGENIAMLLALAEHILDHGLPVTIALENNRRMPDKSDGDSAALVTEVVTAVRASLTRPAPEGYGEAVGEICRTGTNPIVGICFDMGHYAWYRRTHEPDAEYCPPPRDFLSLCVHTHVHALAASGQTHFPFLPDTSLPLAEDLRALGWAYPGVINLELEEERWRERMPLLPALEVSLRALSEASDPCLAVYDDLRAHLTNALTASCALLGGKDVSGTRVSLVHSTFYVGRTGEVRWIIDPALRLGVEMTDAVSRLPALTASADLVLITHGHADHFEEASVRAIRRPGLRWVIPRFLLDTARTFGLTDAEIIPVDAGDEVAFGDLRIRVSEGYHFRPVTRKGIEAVGYRLSYPGEPTLFFPGDVRDFDPAGYAGAGQTDVLFAHVWLGDGICRGDEYPLADAFAAWAAGFGAEKVFLCHLYENGRDADNMWRRDHAELLASRIHSLAAGVEVIIPHGGEVFRI